MAIELAEVDVVVGNIVDTSPFEFVTKVGVLELASVGNIIDT